MRSPEGVRSFAHAQDYLPKKAVVVVMSKVSIIMGSKSDLPVAEKAIELLKRFGITFDIAVASAHRTPGRVEELVKSSGSDVFIAIAGLSAALPGAVASFTVRPVIGVPVSGKVNLDSLLSIVQMPPGVPVATMAVNGSKNAALYAVQILALNDKELSARLDAFRQKQADKVLQTEL